MTAIRNSYKNKDKPIWTWRCTHKNCTAHGVTPVTYNNAIRNARAHMLHAHGGENITPLIILAENTVPQNCKLKSFVWICPICNAHGKKTGRHSYVSNKGRRHMITYHKLYQNANIIDASWMGRGHLIRKGENDELFGPLKFPPYKKREKIVKKCVNCGNHITKVHVALPLCLKCRREREKNAIKSKPRQTITTN